MLGGFVGFIIQRALSAFLPWLKVYVENGLLKLGLINGGYGFLSFAEASPTLELTVRALGFKDFIILAYTFLPSVLLAEWPLYAIFSFSLLFFAMAILFMLMKR